MEYVIYKFNFPTGVHFGNGMLNDSDITFDSDILFSALFIEALKRQEEDILIEYAKNGEVVFSDAFPYMGNEYFVPKPIIHIEPKNMGDSGEKKTFKKLKYINVKELEAFFNGEYSVTEEPLKEFGLYQQQIMTSVRNDGDPIPFYVGTYYYKDGNGLYVIIGYKDDSSMYFIEDLLDSLHYSGIGGKKKSGLGKFDFTYGKNNELIERYLNNSGKHKMLISGALPVEEELENALCNASYSIKKRAGFVYSNTYADEERKKKDLYVFESGSCFENAFFGDIYDVSDGGTHPVYRYAKAMFLEV